MTASEELALLEQSTDWLALIALALSDPPKPCELAFQHSRWGQLFKIARGRNPLPTEYQQDVYAFIRKLAFAAIPPDLIAWADSFESKHGRRPREEDLPKEMLALLPKPGRKGRPRSDTQRMLKVARAWESEIFRSSYEVRREGISTGREAGFNSCFGFSQVDMRGDRPSELALEKLSDETGKSPEYLRDVLFPRRNK